MGKKEKKTEQEIEDARCKKKERIGWREELWKRKELWRRGNKDRVGMMWPKGRLKVVGERERERPSQRERQRNIHMGDFL